MMNINLVIFGGTVVDQPEVRFDKQSRPICQLRVKAERLFRGRTFYTTMKVVAFGELAETLGNVAKEGDSVVVQGRIENRSWTDKDGNERWVTEIVARDLVDTDTDASAAAEGFDPTEPTAQEDIPF